MDKVSRHAINDIVAYRLLPKNRPIHPDKLWFGKAIRYCGREHILIELIEPGYEELREIILVRQVERRGV